MLPEAAPPRAYGVAWWAPLAAISEGGVLGRDRLRGHRRGSGRPPAGPASTAGRRQEIRPPAGDAVQLRLQTCGGWLRSVGCQPLRLLVGPPRRVRPPSILPAADQAVDSSGHRPEITSAARKLVLKYTDNSNSSSQRDHFVVGRHPLKTKATRPDGASRSSSWWTHHPIMHACWSWAHVAERRGQVAGGGTGRERHHAR